LVSAFSSSCHGTWNLCGKLRLQWLCAEAQPSQQQLQLLQLHHLSSKMLRECISLSLSPKRRYVYTRPDPSAKLRAGDQAMVRGPLLQAASINSTIRADSGLVVRCHCRPAPWISASDMGRAAILQDAASSMAPIPASMCMQCAFAVTLREITVA
jgi:hypothetical protein